MAVTDGFSSLAYQAARMLLGAAARVYFRGITVRNIGCVPPRGPLLVVANHPASFTDVIVLGAAIPRRLHFLAMAPIFKPWIRGFALRLCGTLPVYRRQDDSTQMHRNEDTFRACHDFLDRGGAVLIFPEGTSITDRQVVPLKTGAARLALGQERRAGQAGRLTLLPVGLHFADRTGFRTAVAVSIGRPIGLEPFTKLARSDEAQAVRQLTAHLQSALEGLILHVPETDRTNLVHAIVEIYLGELGATRGADQLDLARDIAGCIEYFAVHDPDRVALAQDQVRRYQEQLEALRIQDQTLEQMLPPRGRMLERARLVGLGLLGLVPALAGGLIHYLPYRLSGAAGSLTSDPTRIAAYRIGVAVLLFPVTYGALGLLLYRGLGWAPQIVAFGLSLIALLGLHALLYFQWLSRQSRRIQLVLLKASNRRFVARLRRQRMEIIRMCDASRLDFLAVGAKRKDASA